VLDTRALHVLQQQDVVIRAQSLAATLLDSDAFMVVGLTHTVTATAIVLQHLLHSNTVRESAKDVRLQYTKR
jgi:hypothetical protein